MRLAVKFAAMQLCLGAALAGQTANALPREGAAPQLLSPEQGQALADFALRAGPDVRPKPDCSHLVHMLYSQAGLNYPYERSRVLHRGVPDFLRVKKPQPGDLAVWLGHVGIVLSPEDTTFLSSVRSGIITESWTNDYWSARGRPRFFRYVIGPQTDLTLLADLAPRRGRQTLSASTRRTPAPQQSQIQEEDSGAVSKTSDSRAATGFAPDDAEETLRSLPSDIAVLRQRAKPEKQDIAAAFRQGGADLARELMSGSLLDSERPISIVEQVDVRQLKISREKGDIRLRLTETLTLEHGKSLPGSIVERELTLDRRDGAWVISDPQQRLYIPRAQAVEVLEHQLQVALQNDSFRSDKRGLIKALNFLYDRDALISTSAEARRR